ncbi:MAG: filamentation induced by cAMP protein Fic [Dehalococcoidales bacterium]|nr:filamentation induced by cAMP protein Fic [Dehalococcoidales bacterium]
MEVKFSPKFSQNDELVWPLGEIDRVKFRIERLLIMPKHEQWLRREAFMRTAYSSTKIENNTITEEEIERAAKPSPVTKIPKERVDVSNYTEALSLVDFLSNTDIPIDEAVIRQIHWSLMKGERDTRLQPGKYRTEPNWIEDQGIKVYEPPFHVDVPILMREFSLWLRENGNLNPMLKAGIAHAHLIAIHPFVDGNGRTARLLTTLLLQRNGYGFRNLLSLDAYYQRNKDSYLEALKKSIGGRFTPDYDLTPWLEFFTLSIVVQAGTLEDKLTDWRMWVEKVHREWAPLGLNDRQTDGLIYAIHVGSIARKDYMEITNVSPLTATRDLSHMVAKHILIPRGAGRNRRYYLTTTKNETEKTEGVQPTLI